MKRLTPLLVCALVLAACGDPSGNTGGAASDSEETTTAMTSNEAVTAYTQCMRDNGVEIEDPTADAEGNPIPGSMADPIQPGDNSGAGEGPGTGLDEDTQAALQECNELLDGTGLGFGGPAGGDPEAFQKQFAELTSCLEEEGIEIPEPDSSAGEGQPGSPFDGLGNLDVNDPEVQAAMEQCAEFFPNLGGRGGPSGGQGGDNG